MLRSLRWTRGTASASESRCTRGERRIDEQSNPPYHKCFRWASMLKWRRRNSQAYIKIIPDVKAMKRWLGECCATYKDKRIGLTQSDHVTNVEVYYRVGTRIVRFAYDMFTT